MASQIVLSEVLDPNIRDPHSGEIVDYDSDKAQALETVRELIDACGHLSRFSTVQQWSRFHSALERFAKEGEE